TTPCTFTSCIFRRTIAPCSCPTQSSRATPSLGRRTPFRSNGTARVLGIHRPERPPRNRHAVDALLPSHRRRRWRTAHHGAACPCRARSAAPREAGDQEKKTCGAEIGEKARIKTELRL